MKSSILKFIISAVVFLATSSDKMLWATEVLKLSNIDSSLASMHKPIVLTFQPKEFPVKMDHPEALVFALEGVDIKKTISLLQHPLYQIDDFAGEEISFDTLNQLKAIIPLIYSFDLRETYFDNEKLKLLAQFDFTNLRVFKLDDNRFDDDGLKYLPEFGKRIRSLSLVGNKVTHKGVNNLLPLKELEFLDMGCTYLGNEGIQSLTTTLPQLRHLDVRSCGFDDSVLECFLKFPNLESLNISKNTVSTESLQRFLNTEQGKKIKVTAENLR